MNLGNTLRRAIAYLLAGVAMLTFVCAMAMTAVDGAYVNYPRDPVVSTGRVVPYPVKGIIVYTTEREHDLGVAIKRGTMAGAALIAILLVLNRIWPFPKGK